MSAPELNVESVALSDTEQQAIYSQIVEQASRVSEASNRVLSIQNDRGPRIWGKQKWAQKHEADLKAANEVLETAKANAVKVINDAKLNGMSDPITETAHDQGPSSPNAALLTFLRQKVESASPTQVPAPGIQEQPAAPQDDPFKVSGPHRPAHDDQFFGRPVPVVPDRDPNEPIDPGNRRAGFPPVSSEETAAMSPVTLGGSSDLLDQEGVADDAVGRGPVVPEPISPSTPSAPEPLVDGAAGGGPGPIVPPGEPPITPPAPESVTPASPTTEPAAPAGPPTVGPDGEPITYAGPPEIGPDGKPVLPPRVEPGAPTLPVPPPPPRGPEATTSTPEVEKSKSETEADEAAARLDAAVEKLPDAAKAEVKKALEARSSEKADIEKRYGDQKKKWNQFKKWFGESAVCRGIGGALKVGQGAAEITAGMHTAGWTGLFGPALFAHGTAKTLEGISQIIGTLREGKPRSEMEKASTEIEAKGKELEKVINEYKDGDEAKIEALAKEMQLLESKRLDAKAAILSLRAKHSLTGMKKAIFGGTLGTALVTGLPTGMQALGGIPGLSTGHATFLSVKGWMFGYKAGEAAVAQGMGAHVGPTALLGHAGHTMGATSTLANVGWLAGGLAIAGAALFGQAKYSNIEFGRLQKEIAELEARSEALKGLEAETPAEAPAETPAVQGAPAVPVTPPPVSARAGELAPEGSSDRSDAQTTESSGDVGTRSDAVGNRDRAAENTTVAAAAETEEEYKNGDPRVGKECQLVGLEPVNNKEYDAATRQGKEHLNPKGVYQATVNGKKVFVRFDDENYKPTEKDIRAKVKSIILRKPSKGGPIREITVSVDDVIIEQQEKLAPVSEPPVTEKPEGEITKKEKPTESLTSDEKSEIERQVREIMPVALAQGGEWKLKPETATFSDESRDTTWVVNELLDRGIDSRVLIQPKGVEISKQKDRPYKTIIHDLWPAAIETILNEVPQAKKHAYESNIQSEIVQWVKENIEKEEKPPVTTVVAEEPAPSVKPGDNPIVDLETEPAAAPAISEPPATLTADGDSTAETETIGTAGEVIPSYNIEVGGDSYVFEPGKNLKYGDQNGVIQEIRDRGDKLAIMTTDNKELVVTKDQLSKGIERGVISLG
ncbi:MAG: hypothetical protein WC451_04420 [Patescibacteria group bacterium]